MVEFGSSSQASKHKTRDYVISRKNVFILPVGIQRLNKEIKVDERFTNYILTNTIHGL